MIVCKFNKSCGQSQEFLSGYAEFFFQNFIQIRRRNPQAPANQSVIHLPQVLCRSGGTDGQKLFHRSVQHRVNFFAKLGD